MDTYFETRKAVQNFVTRVATKSGTDTEQIMALGRRQGWDCAIIGRGPLHKEAFRQGDWLVVPIEQDSSGIPQRAMKRVEKVFAAGIRPAGFVLAHEAPANLLPGPVEEPLSIQERLSEMKDNVVAAGEDLAGPAGEVLKALVKAVAVVALGVVGLFLLAALIVPVVAVMGFALGWDPMLIAVMEDGYWVAIDSWDV